ncbi:histone deacetylation protein Rxt3-domain-containing protein, partial [Lipomyces oligophaga]|uniref:histone deacetylation protein Rxt3-domain-containing protein n=1 Tax=Lipomyces oligophaga TaxID=45792 RepID=UPI0034CEC6E0
SPHFHHLHHHHHHHHHFHPHATHSHSPHDPSGHPLPQTPSELPLQLANYQSRYRSASPISGSPTLPVLLTVESSAVFEAASMFPADNLGFLIYTPTPAKRPFLPRLPTKINSTIQIRIPRQFLLRHANPHIGRREVWGTDIYTDDSDIVAALYHTGYLAKLFEPDVDDVVTKGDCLATIRLLPLLERYQGSCRNGMNSRSWIIPHDGISYSIEGVEFVEKGKAQDRGWEMKKRRLEEWRTIRELKDEH